MMTITIRVITLKKNPRTPHRSGLLRLPLAICEQATAKIRAMPMPMRELIAPLMDARTFMTTSLFDVKGGLPEFSVAGGSAGRV
jgi:hypothetical protein